MWTLVAQRMELSEREIAGPIDVWGTDRAEDTAECAFLGRGKENADRSLPMTKEQVFEDLFEAEGSPYWRFKQEQVMDVRCALWSWPLDKVRLLDGTDAEYATVPVVAGAGTDLEGLLSSVHRGGRRLRPPGGRPALGPSLRRWPTASGRCGRRTPVSSSGSTRPWPPARSTGGARRVRPPLRRDRAARRRPQAVAREDHPETRHGITTAPLAQDGQR
ncbi:hypothetical protein ACIP4Y_10405 [Streptomyces sp. NPDC088810]|uniref:hypothetical protein n=1 Tax=Streptomyces sp. NPDC088810 TaxID=3365904 RepID=UPI0038220113